MFTTLIILALIASILLILIVLIQKPKGGGIAASFSAGNQIMGVKRTNDFVEKATWTLAIALLVFVLASNMFYNNDEKAESILQDRLEEVDVNDFSTGGDVPTPAPQNDGTSDQ